MSMMDWGRNNVNAGPLPELKEICIDRFIRNDLKSTTFFLSHAHTDHTVGLETEEFLERLNQPGVRLYCQAITPILLGDFQRYLGGEVGIQNLVRANKLIPLDAEKTIEIEVPANPCSYQVELTLLPAGHCPGSVMFLFETGSKRILHTGDCRITVADLKEMRHLHWGPVSKGHVKSFDHLIIDSTFCSTSAEVFPDRKIAFEEAMSYIRNHTKLGENYYIKLKFAARFAHEYILLELHKIFGHKTHVNTTRYSIYEQIPGLRDCVTLNPKTPFHLCDNQECFCGKETLTVRLSSMWYTKSQETSRSPVIKRGSLLSVCYSMHSSLTEIAEMIDYLKPVVVTPFVRPHGSELEKVRLALTSLCKWKFEYEDYQAGNAETIDDKSLSPVHADLSEECCIPIPKRVKTDDSSSSKWNFCFTPSPTKSGSSSRENSQEIVLESGSASETTTRTSKAVKELKSALAKQDFRENHGF